MGTVNQKEGVRYIIIVVALATGIYMSGYVLGVEGSMFMIWIIS